MTSGKVLCFIPDRILDQTEVVNAEQEIREILQQVNLTIPDEEITAA